MNVPEKRQIHEAWIALTTQQAAIKNGFAPALANAVAQDTQVGSAQSVRSMASLRFDDLELMGEDQVQDKLNATRLQQVFLLASEAGFAGFSARLSKAQGYKTVKTDKNSLRPEIIARALAITLQDLPVEPKVRTRWLVYGGQIMGDLLQQLYTQLQVLLEEQGVQQAAYQVTSAPDETGRGESPIRQNQAHPESASAGQDTYLSRERLLTPNHLHRLMSGEYDDSFGSSADAMTSLGHDVGQANSAFAQGFSGQGTPSISAALGVMEELKKNGAGNKGQNAARPMPPVPVALMRAQLKTDSHGLGQSLAIEVVGMMVEQLSTDARLLAPVR